MLEKSSISQDLTSVCLCELIVNINDGVTHYFFSHVNKNDELINLLSVMRNKHYKIGYYILYFCSTM